jgi:hypothetical protein
MFCVKGLLGEHKKYYQIMSVPYTLVLSLLIPLLWHQQVLLSSSWMVVVKRAGAVGDQPSGVDLPWEVWMSGKAEGWAAAYGFTSPKNPEFGNIKLIHSHVIGHSQ